MKFMKEMNGVMIHSNESMSDEDCRAYILWARDKNPGSLIESMNLVFDGENVAIEYKIAPVPFQKIRRITGYLVGDMSHWNNAKMDEEHDRVKHGL